MAIIVHTIYNYQSYLQPWLLNIINKRASIVQYTRRTQDTLLPNIFRRKLLQVISNVVPCSAPSMVPDWFLGSFFAFCQAGCDGRRSMRYAAEIPRMRNPTTIPATIPPTVAGFIQDPEPILVIIVLAVIVLIATVLALIVLAAADIVAVLVTVTFLIRGKWRKRILESLRKLETERTHYWLINSNSMRVPVKIGQNADNAKALTRERPILRLALRNTENVQMLLVLLRSVKSKSLVDKNVR